MPLEPIKIRFSEQAGIYRNAEPVSFGVPLPPGSLLKTETLVLSDDTGNFLPSDTRTLATWPDGSVRWLLVDTQVTVGANEDRLLTLTRDKHAGSIPGPPVMTVDEAAGEEVTIDTGKTAFCVGTAPTLQLFKRIGVAGGPDPAFGPSPLTLTDTGGKTWYPMVDRYTIEHDTRLKKVLLIHGHFGSDGKKNGMVFRIWAHFHAGSSGVRLDIAVRNPKQAVHRGGAWDLGDPNSIRFRDLVFTAIPRTDGPMACCYTLNTDHSQTPCRGKYNIFQASSGGVNWDSANHVNHEKKIPLQFSGFKVFEDGKEIANGDRANPIGAVRIKHVWLSLCCSQFWQNFPKAMDIEGSGICIGLFPDCHGEPFELQPGEEKTHTLYMALDDDPLTPLKSTADPLIPVLSCRDLFLGITSPRPVPFRYPAYEELIQHVTSGPNSFSAKNEQVDEFGWRNFGDVWADHESAYSGNPLISHYNNQYDLIKGLLLQFMRSGESRWFKLARNMGNHVTDIDMYHTDQDKPQYNNGLFWHTDHYLDAATSTHRTFSREHVAAKPLGCFGGGPAPDHNYATGLLYLYWLTGESRYKHGVLDLAENIIFCMNAPNSFSELAVDLLKKGITKIRNRGAHDGGGDLGFTGPSRSSGNSLNTLVDAYLLTGDHRYITHAEDLIYRCVSLDDDFEDMGLHDAETRWMYTIFLLALGRYLEIKHRFEQTDPHFFFAREVLLQYAGWMAENERPYLETPEALEYPTETWAAQDIRKADIFAYAASLADGEKQALFKAKCRFFLDDCLTRLNTFETRYFTRPMAILLTNGMPSLKLMSGKSDAGYPAGMARGRQGSRKSRLLSILWRNLVRFSLKKEIRWIRIQLDSRL